MGEESRGYGCHIESSAVQRLERGTDPWLKIVGSETVCTGEGGQTDTEGQRMEGFVSEKDLVSDV